MSEDGNGMTADEHALAKAWEDYREDGHSCWRVKNACRAYHKAMISLTTSVKFHETDGTVRLVVLGDL